VSGLLYFASPMRRLDGAARIAVLCAVAIGSAPAVQNAQEPLRPRGRYNNSVHRFFPDLDSRLNAVRYGRWRALEIAWTVGINPDLDRQFSAFLLKLLGDPPRFPPEAEFVAPRFAREASPVFHALHWGQVLEQQVGDVLASADATPALTATRLELLAPQSARILLSGTRLFVRAGEALAASDFGQQRWKVRDTIEEFDSSLSREKALEESTHPISAPILTERYPGVGAQLDRVTRFRLEVYGALEGGGATPEARRRRDEKLREVAKRYGLSTEGIGGT
jgi:hypothetical protein